MFTLWYTILSWKEYREVILESIRKKKPSESKQVSDSKLEDINKEVSSVPPVVKSEQPKKPIAESTKTPPSPLTQQITKAIPKTNEQVKPPKPPSPTLPLKKPVRLPSPHPIHNDDFEIEYEEESDEEDDEDEDEEDEEDSIVDLVPISKAPLKKSVNDFIKQEVSNQNSIGGSNRSISIFERK